MVEIDRQARPERKAPQKISNHKAKKKMSPPRCSISFHLKRQLRQNQILKQNFYARYSFPILLLLLVKKMDHVPNTTDELLKS